MCVCVCARPSEYLLCKSRWSVVKWQADRAGKTEGKGEKREGEVTEKAVRMLVTAGAFGWEGPDSVRSLCHGESNTMKMEMPQPAVYLAQPAAHTDTE